MLKSNRNLILLVFLFFIAYSNIQPQYEEIVEFEVEEYNPADMELERFLNDIGFKESSNRYHIVNEYGYLGRYQFSPRTLKGLGFNISKKEFLSNPDVQDEAMICLLQHNKRVLQHYIDKWDGKIKNGVKITESGILAAAHLTGATSVKRFFKYGINRKDAYGTSIVDYMNKFSGYEIKI